MIIMVVLGLSALVCITGSVVEVCKAAIYPLHSRVALILFGGFTLFLGLMFVLVLS